MDSEKPAASEDVNYERVFLGLGVAGFFVALGFAIGYGVCV